MAKGKKTGGRAKGVKNKHTFQAEELANRLGVDPLEVLLNAAKGDWEALGYDSECYFSEGPNGEVRMGYVLTPEARINAAKEACKYLYSQKRTVELSNPDGTGFKITVEDYTAKKA